MKFTIFVDPSLVIITIYLDCLSYAFEYRRRILKNTSILHFLLQNYLPLGWGTIEYTISYFLTLQMLHTKFGQGWPSSFWEENVNWQRTKHDDGRQPIAIGHLSDLIKESLNTYFFRQFFYR